MMLNKFRQFMIGRYGTDSLGICLIILYFGLSILSTALRLDWLLFLSYVFFALELFRMFSKNIYARQKENQKFLFYLQPVKKQIELLKRKNRDGSTHKFYKCPKCKQTIRVPKGKGKICITCPKCRHEFIKRT